jgi:hypothetical protein
MKPLILVLAITAALAASCGTTRKSAATTAPGVPKGTTFTARVDNPWFPLKPGTTYVYRGVKDGKPARDVVKVSNETKTIQGAQCAVVRDRLYLNGRLGERTTDWYTQDQDGNVWYFGEDTAELDANGNITSTEGTWQTGRDGAEPGIFMPAHPEVGDSYRQEFYKGHAEDHFEILSLRASVKTPYVSSRRAILTKETTPLEPGTVDHKFYVRGLGTVLEATVKGSVERSMLVAVRSS